MKRFLTTSLMALGLFAGGGLSFVPTAHAIGQSCSANNDCEIGEKCEASVCVADTAALQQSTTANTQGGLTATGGLTPEQNAAAAALRETTSQIPTAVQTNPDVSKGFGPIMTWIMSLFAWLVGVAALVLNYAIYYTVVTMGDYVHNLTAVGVAWRILRDISNIALIFGFLGIGISVILETNWYGVKTKMLPMLLVAAVFLNFSLFISEAIIDAGNLFATQFYTQINGGTLPTKASLAAASPSTEGISNKIMSQLGFQSIYNPNQKALENGPSWLVAFMGIILFIITAFVLFTIAFVLISRFVFLLYLIIIAPLGFAGLAAPQLKRVSDYWWENLFKQTITAPVLLLLLYIALTIITDTHFLTGFTAVASQDAWLGYIDSKNIAGFAGVLLSFLVAMGALLYCVIAARQLGAYGAAGATKLAGKLSFGMTGWALNRTVGRGAYRLQRSLRQSATFNRVNAATGRIMTRTLDRAATGSFDVRGATLLGGLSGGLGIDAGKAKEGGFVAARKANIKDHEGELKRIEEAHKEAEWEATKQEEKDIAEAAEKAKQASESKKAAQAAQEAAAQADAVEHRAHEANKVEVARLEQIDAADRAAGRISSVGGELRAAKERMAATQAGIETTSKALEEAKNVFKAAEEASKAADKKKKEAEAAPEERKKKSLKENKIAYAENINRGGVVNPFNLIAYGPSGGAVSRKLIEGIKHPHSTKDDIFHALEKHAEHEYEEKHGGHDDRGGGHDDHGAVAPSHAPAPKPAAAAAPAAHAPASGGGGGHGGHH